MSKSVLVALNDSTSSRGMIAFLTELPLCREDVRVELLHVFRRPEAVQELMGQRFTAAQPSRLMSVMERARDTLVEAGFDGGRIELTLLEDPYPTVSDAIIHHFRKGRYDLLMIGRKRMSKAEEFVLGDISIKLVRALGGAAVLVVNAT